MKHSDELKNLAKALAKFQADIKDPARDKDNPYFKSKYVALDGLLDAVRPVLAANGLSFIQSPVSNGQDMGVATLLMHDSGEWIESDPFMLHAVKNDPQAGGSAITYARRYSLSAVLGVAWDDDDDANMATKGHQSRSNVQNAPAKGDCTKAGRQAEKNASSSSQTQKSLHLLTTITSLSLTGLEQMRPSCSSGRCSKKNSIRGISRNCPLQRQRPSMKTSIN